MRKVLQLRATQPKGRCNYHAHIENVMKTTRLRDVRQARGLSIYTVAGAVRTDPGNLSRIERGTQNASPALAARLAAYFSPDLSELEILYPERCEGAK